MKGIPATYLGKIVSKENFRVYVYGVKNEQKLVESWDEFERCMESGIWFAAKEDANRGVLEPKAESKDKSKVSKRKNNVLADLKEETSAVDDFLSSEN